VNTSLRIGKKGVLEGGKKRGGEGKRAENRNFSARRREESVKKVASDE